MCCVVIAVLRHCCLNEWQSVLNWMAGVPSEPNPQAAPCHLWRAVPVDHISAANSAANNLDECLASSGQPAAGSCWSTSGAVLHCTDVADGTWCCFAYTQ